MESLGEVPFFAAESAQGGVPKAQLYKVLKTNCREGPSWCRAAWTRAPLPPTSVTMPQKWCLGPSLPRCGISPSEESIPN